MDGVWTAKDAKDTKGAKGETFLSRFSRCFAGFVLQVNEMLMPITRPAAPPQNKSPDRLDHQVAVVGALIRVALLVRGEIEETESLWGLYQESPPLSMNFGRGYRCRQGSAYILKSGGP
jgi:hypothetical protein